MNKVLPLILLITQASVASAQVSEHPPGSQTQPTLSLCAFQYGGPGGGFTFLFGLAGVAADVAIAKRQAPRIDQLGRQVERIFEDALATSGRFRYIRSEQLTTVKDGRNLSVREAVTANQLSACIHAVSSGGAGFGWNKQAVSITQWHIIGDRDWHHTITTNVASREKYGKFPEPADVNLHPVYLDLARESVEAFIAKLDEMMKQPDFAQRLQATKRLDSTSNQHAPVEAIAAEPGPSSKPPLAPSAPVASAAQAPATRERTAFAIGNRFTVDALPSMFAKDVLTVISGTGKRGVYVIEGDVVMVDNAEFIWCADTIKIAPNVTVPTGSPQIRNEAVRLVPKLHLDEPRTVRLELNSGEYISSGPNGCTLKRTQGRELLLVEGEAFLSSKYPD